MTTDFIYVRGHLLAEQFIVHIEPGMQETPYLDPDHFQGPEALMYHGGNNATLAFLVTDIFGRQLVVCKGEGGPAYEYIDRLQRATFARMMNEYGPANDRQMAPPRPAPIRSIKLMQPPANERAFADDKTQIMHTP